MTTSDTTTTTKDDTMTTAVTKLPPRLISLEKRITKCAESIQKNGLEIGRALCEIRDDELWVGPFDSWDKYLKERARELIGKSFSQASNLIQAAEIQKRLPESIQSIGLNPTHLKELGRLAPSKNGNPKHRDYSQIKKPDLARVVQRATEIAGDDAPSVRDIRQAVDDDLGINRAEQAKQMKLKQKRDLDERVKRQQEQEAREQEYQDKRNELSQFLILQKAEAKRLLEQLEVVPQDGWWLLHDSQGYVVDQLVGAMHELCAFLEATKSCKPAISPETHQQTIEATR